jgi:hypothetical protein
LSLQSENPVSNICCFKCNLYRYTLVVYLLEHPGCKFDRPLGKTSKEALRDLCVRFYAKRRREREAREKKPTPLSVAQATAHERERERVASANANARANGG